MTIRDREHTSILILGSGPSGYTAAICAARAQLSPILVAGLQPGGQLTLTTDVENYPGFPEGIGGPEMMELFQKQATRFGTRMFFDDAIDVDLTTRPFRISTEENKFTADSVLVSTGASARWLGLDSEERLMNRGVSACATCDGALFRNRDIAVVGGGDTAIEEALFLTRFATKVTVIHRRNELRASKIMAERALNHDSIEFVWNAEVREVLGDESVTGVRLADTVTGVCHDVGVEALFVAIGHQPNSSLFKGQLELDDAGYISVVPGTTQTSMEGVFACGDVADPTYRQAITAAGTGCMAAIESERWLAERTA